MEHIDFTIPLPIAAIVMFILGALYKLWKFNKVIKCVVSKKGNVINTSYKNYLFSDVDKYQPTFLPLDPDREMENLSKNWIIRLYSRNNANLIYSRVLDCIDKHRFMLNSMAINNDISKDKQFNRNYLNNAKLYFYLTDILKLKNNLRVTEFEKFSKDKQYVYDDDEGYFKEYLTLYWSPET